MTEYEELRAGIDRYLMERFKYRKSLVWLTVDNIKSYSKPFGLLPKVCPQEHSKMSFQPLKKI